MKTYLKGIVILAGILVFLPIVFIGFPLLLAREAGGGDECNPIRTYDKFYAWMCRKLNIKPLRP